MAITVANDTPIFLHVVAKPELHQHLCAVGVGVGVEVGVGVGVGAGVGVGVGVDVGVDVGVLG